MKNRDVLAGAVVILLIGLAVLVYGVWLVSSAQPRGVTTQTYPPLETITRGPVSAPTGTLVLTARVDTMGLVFADVTERQAAALCRLTALTTAKSCVWNGTYPQLSGAVDRVQLKAERDRATGAPITLVQGAGFTYEFTDPTAYSENYVFIAMKVNTADRTQQTLRKIVPTSVVRSGDTVHVAWAGNVLENGRVVQLPPGEYVMLAANMDSLAFGYGASIVFTN